MADREKVFLVRPYMYKVHVVVSSDILASFTKRRLPSLTAPSDSTYAFTWTHNACQTVYVFLPEECGLGATAHEMLHVVDFFMNRSGVGYNDEAWAYHLEELVQMASEFVHSKGRKYRRN